MADALGVRTNTTREPLEVLVEYFRNRQHVLVLDNLEQVIDVRTPLAQLRGPHSNA